MLLVLAMNDDELLRYSRHILLEDFDIAGQEKLLASSVLVIGAGGLGCPVAMYLAASGIGSLVLVDDDHVELTNLQRQIGHRTQDTGRAKVLSLADALHAINPHVQVEPVEERLHGSTLDDRVAAVDLVIDCSDNFSTRLAVNRACVQYGRPLVSGAAIRAEGQVAVFNRTSGSPCYACLYGEQFTEENLTCSESGVLSPLVGIVGSIQAAEAVKILAGYGEPMDGKLLLLDIRSAEWRVLSLKKDPACPVCG